MQRSAILLVVPVLFVASSATAQSTATDSNSSQVTSQNSPWQRFFGPITGFSRGGGESTSQAPTNVIQSSDTLVPPPPAPALAPSQPSSVPSLSPLPPGALL